MKPVRVANGQGFWGDSPAAPIEQVQRGPIDYLTLDYLAELTMSILQKQRGRDPRAGYARDFVTAMSQLLPHIMARGIRVVANAGGVNPEACRDAVLEVARARGFAGLKVAVITGDDILNRLDDFLRRGLEMKNLDTGASLASVRSRVLSANVYFGARPIAEALQRGGQIVITGRCTDAALVLGPLVHEFGWAADDWNKLAAGTIAGHVVECGAQATGGNCQAEWEAIPNLADIGYPIVEAWPDGTFVLTKHSGTGGRVSLASVKEQLLYELGDPRTYITPDCVADFTTIRLEQEGPDRVRFSGLEGCPPPDTYKVSVSYAAGFKAAGALIYAWPDAYKKAQAADRILRERLARLGLRFDHIHTEYVGVNACHGPLAGNPPPDAAEVVLRVAVRSEDRTAVERFGAEIAPLALNGPPTVTLFTTGRPKAQEIIGYWPALLPKSEAAPEISLKTA
jgi:hypothetical protein